MVRPVPWSCSSCGLITPHRFSILARFLRTSTQASTSRNTYPAGTSAKLFLIEQVDAEHSVLIPIRDGRPFRSKRPFDPNDLRIRIVERSHISESKIGRDLLL